MVIFYTNRKLLQQRLKYKRDLYLNRFQVRCEDMRNCTVEKNPKSHAEFKSFITE